MKKLCFNAAVGAILAGFVVGPTYALDVSVGGSRDGGVKASVRSGGKSVSAKVGGSRNTADVKASVGSAAKARATVGGDNNIARAKAGVLGNNAKVNVGGGSGSTLSLDQNGNPLNGTSNTNLNVNLGGLGGLLGAAGGGGVGGGGGTIDRNVVKVAFRSMSTGSQAQVQQTCKGVLNNPRGFEPGMVDLCRLLISL